MAQEREWRLVVPTVDNSGNPLRADVVMKVARDMAEYFGGVTVYPAAGCYWPKDKPDMHCDPDMVITSSELEGAPRRSDAANEAFMTLLANDVGKELGQENMYVSEITTDYAQWVPGQERATADPQFIDPRGIRVPASKIFEEIMPARHLRR